MARKRKLIHSRVGGVGAVAVLLLLVLAGVFFGRNTPAAEIPERTAAPIAAGSIEVQFLDVGQGDSALVRIPNGEGYYTMLVDTGEKKYAQGLENHLRGLGITRIDVLICSHPHADHMGGMAQLIRHFDIGEIFMPDVPDSITPTTAVYEDMLDAVLEKGLSINVLCEGAYIDVPNGAKIEVYAPGKQGNAYTDLNNYSGIFKLIYGETSFLFTGDAEKALEKETLSKDYDLRATVLKCGHHGSAGATSAAFLQAVSPEYAVISCGAGNIYGHPSETILRRLQDFGCETLRTDTEKTIIMQSDGARVTVETGKPSIAAGAGTTEEEWTDAA